VTAESVWRAWRGMGGLPEPSLPAAGERVVVVSAHPDDDVLAVGGLLHRLSRRGCELVLVRASDGEASHPGSPTLGPEQLAAARRQELAHALAELGHSGAERVSLGLPDSRVGERPDELVRGLVPRLAGAALVLAPWSGDGHPDHEACGRAARTVVGDVLWEYPVWAWHWARPPGDPATGPGAPLPWQRAARLRLSGAEQRVKAAAIGCFRTQVAPLSDDPADAVVLPADVLAHFDRPYEVVFT